MQCNLLPRLRSFTQKKKKKKKKEKCEMGKDKDNKFEHPGKSYENFKVIWLSNENLLEHTSRNLGFWTILSQDL